jgi:membrane-associated phospholipid phosphatase
MDAIESMDWGAYAHFRFAGQQQPQIVHWMRNNVYPLGSYLSVGFLLLIALLLLLGQKRRRAALVGVLTFLAAIALIELTHFVVPRRRPPDAQNFLGPNAMLGSYPSSSVFLFMLVVILVGFAMWEPLRSNWLRGVYVLAAGVLTVGVCLSQFFLCVHFVTDVIGAFAGAALFGWIACRLMADGARGMGL